MEVGPSDEGSDEGACELPSVVPLSFTDCPVALDELADESGGFCLPVGPPADADEVVASEIALGYNAEESVSIHEQHATGKLNSHSSSYVVT